MRRILLIFIILLVVILGITTVFKGTKIGRLEISSVSQIAEKNKELDGKITSLNNSIDIEYPAKISELKTASQNMQNAKDEYLEETNRSTDAQILEAMQQKNYRIEFLWVRLETHAREESVVLKFEILPSSLGANTVNDIKFTVNGTYNNTIKFITAIENDTDLNFKIENFKMQPTDSGKMGELLGIDTGGTTTGELRYIILESTFNVKNVTLEDDTLSQITSKTQTTDNTQSTTSSNNSNSKTNTTNTNTTNTNTTNSNTTNTNTAAESTNTTGNNNSEENGATQEKDQKTAKDVMQEF